MITELVLRKLSCKDGKRIEVWDGKMPGFGVRMSPAGTKTFILMYYVGGRKRRVSLGRYPIVSLADARKKAGRILNKVADGEDPKAALGAGAQFKGAVEAFLERHAARHYRASHTREVGRLLRARFVSVWGDRALASIGPGEVRSVIHGVLAAGAPSAANHALAVIRKFFNWCVEEGLLDANPAAPLRRPAPVLSRERFLSETEVGSVWRAAEETEPPFSQVVRLLMLTAQRRGEVVGMRWDEVGWSDGTWSIPGSRTKNGRAHVVPLSKPALEVLKSVARTHDELVFPARGNADATMSGFSKMKARMEQVSGVSGWTLHDLRRTAATHMARLGIAPHVIERVLNHTTGVLGGVAGIYNRFEYLPEMRHALQVWAEHVRTLAAASRQTDTVRA